MWESLCGPPCAPGRKERQQRQQKQICGGDGERKPVCTHLASKTVSGLSLGGMCGAAKSEENLSGREDVSPCDSPHEGVGDVQAALITHVRGLAACRRGLEVCSVRPVRKRRAGEGIAGN